MKLDSANVWNDYTLLYRRYVEVLHLLMMKCFFMLAVMKF